MKKITKLNKKFFLKGILPLLLLLCFIYNPLKVSAEVAETEINGKLINASSEFLRDLDFETWQLVAYKSHLLEQGWESVPPLFESSAKTGEGNKEILNYIESINSNL